MKTRARRTAPSVARASVDGTATATATVPALGPRVENAPRLFVLPADVTPNARIITLPHPAAAGAARYLADPEHGFYEFTRIAAPTAACRSWLLSPEGEGAGSAEPSSPAVAGRDEDGYVLRHPDLFVATLIDPLFLLLPVLWPREGGPGRQEWGSLHDKLFLGDGPVDGGAGDGYGQLQAMLQSPGGHALEQMLQKRMHAVCDVRQMGADEDDAYYSLADGRLARVIYDKATEMVRAGLPASMEQRFVKEVLEMPELGVRREESDPSSAVDDAGPDPGAGAESVENASSGAAQVTSPLADRGRMIEDTHGPQAIEVTHLLRLRTALQYLLTNYTPPSLRQHLHSIYNDAGKQKFIDFTPLDNHLARLNQLKAEAQALRSISDNISRKRGVLDDDEALERAEAKRRKKDEEEAKKKNMSQGVKKLMKADTSGMKKLSSFFSKTPAKK